MAMAAMAAAAAAASKKPCRQVLAKGGDGREERGGSGACRGQ